MVRNQFSLIRTWAEDKGIYAKGDVMTQYVKLSEEGGELAKALINEDMPEIIDAIGDMAVVLTNVAELVNRKYYLTGKDAITIEKCIESAWNVIKERQGEMKNGSFVKESNKVTLKDTGDMLDVKL